MRYSTFEISSLCDKTIFHRNSTFIINRVVTVSFLHWVIVESMVLAIQSGALWETFSMIVFTWKHKLWICLSQLGKASRAVRKTKQQSLNFSRAWILQIDTNLHFYGTMMAYFLPFFLSRYHHVHRGLKLQPPVYNQNFHEFSTKWHFICTYPIKQYYLCHAMLLCKCAKIVPKL